MELRHYPMDENFAFDPHRTYSREPVGNGKPEGFWVSVVGEDDWANWCRIEDFHAESIDNPYAVILKPSANIRIIDSIVKLEGLDAELTMRLDAYQRDRRYARDYDWDHVYRDWDGIIIAPYFWEARYGPRWYWAWDVASGCIWNLDAIETVTKITVEEQLYEDMEAG